MTTSPFFAGEGRPKARTPCSPFLLNLLLLANGALAAPVTPLKAPESAVGGVTQAQWSKQWWQWAASFEPSESPIGDRSGALGQAGQRGEVWFLAGTYGSHRVERTCRVPAGRHLFFPLMNYVVLRNPANPASCEQLKRTARAMTDEPSFLLLEIDGQLHENLVVHRQAPAGCFQVTSSVLAAADGYYVMLSPLAKGRHVINFGGMLPRLAQAVTYTLDVE